MLKNMGITMLLAGWLTLIAASPADAGTFTLSDRNSSAYVDTESVMGMSDWVVDGVDHLFSQWFWVRIGDVGPETSIDDLELLGEVASNTNFDPGLDTLAILYGDSVDAGSRTFEVEIRFSLAGGQAGTGLADMAEQIVIRNVSDGTLSLNFFQYSDFDLGGTPGGDTVRFTNPNTVRQTSNGGVLNETVVTPVADHRELALYSDTFDRLEDGVATDLNGYDDPLSGDVTWAFQWDLTLGAGADILISKDKSIQIPAPGAILLAGLGLSIVGWIRRKSA